MLRTIPGIICFFLFQADWFDWREEEATAPAEPLGGLGKITEQKGILGPGPPELRFPEAL
ncbi:hypothetical protein CDL15_Pgr026122 [Punica granatum]|uniref:Uncharacterized protein n=1 Tax=Punica granatum TaxID=22663 RepID=A0A218WDY3_PUNGR|nr:hypothetical protein CDL15_Pgr026122 [Punica granatum]